MIVYSFKNFRQHAVIAQKLWVKQQHSISPCQILLNVQIKKRKKKIDDGRQHEKV